MPRRLKVTDVNAHVTCTICDGYLVDATAITECLHAFCRTCIVRYLETSKFCPVCDVQVHKTKPLLSIRSDQTLQDLVYKMVPGLYQNEMQRRKEFYAEHPEAATGVDPEMRGEGERRFFSPRESISLSLHHRPKDLRFAESSHGMDPTTRHLSCPAAFSIGHLKKFIHLKFSLPSTYTVDIFYDEQLLLESFTLMDVAYIYSWKRAEPMKFFYSISKCVTKIMEQIPAVHQPPAASEMEVDSTKSETAIPDDLPEVNVAASADSETEPMQIDIKPPERETDKNDEETFVLSPLHEISSQMIPVVPSPVVPSALPGEEATISSETLSVVSPSEGSERKEEDRGKEAVQPMDVTESEAVKCNSSLSENILAVLPPVQEPTYNSVKLVSTPERDAVLSPTNGFRLKFIHDPELPKPRSKKSGRKSGKSSKHKSVPLRLARLAPYPPPPVTCLTTQSLQHLPQLAVRKLVPSVITTLPPTFVTTLVSTSSNPLCSVTNDSSVSLLGQPLTTVCNISTPSLPTTSTANSISSSSTDTANNMAASAISQDRISAANTKELPCTDSENIVVIPTCVPSSTTSSTVSSVVTTCSESPVSESPKLPCPVSGTEMPDSFTNCSNLPVKPHESPSDKQSPTPHLCSKDVDFPDAVSSSSKDTSLLVNTISKTTPDSNSHNNRFILEHPSMEPLTNGEEKDRPISNDRETIFENADQKSESFKRSVKNSISAEFSDNDDLGCQPDLVVDEQKMDSSENEDDTDAALRKKINAIAEKEDEADVTDDTEADSGRASDMSCPARCEEDIGSPATTETVTSSSVSATITATSSSVVDSNRHTKSNNIDHVIKQLYLQHEIGRPVSSPKRTSSTPPQTSAPPKDDMGVLDLSVCTRKPGDVPSTRPKPVANPVLDIKHRQQTYLPAPIKQHTACPPAPKHPTSPLLMHQLTTRHNTPSILQAQLTGNPKPSHHPLPFVGTCGPYSLPISRVVSSPASLPIRSTQPTYSYRYPQFSGMLSYPMMDMSSYGVRAGMVSVPGRPSSSLSKDVTPSSSSASSSSSTTTANSKILAFTKQSSASRRFSDTFVSGTPPPVVHCKVPTLPSSTSAPAHPRTSPSVLSRMSPHHRSASPAPSPHTAVSLSMSSSSLTTASSQCKQSVPIYKKSESSSSSYKGFKVKRNANLAVFNPDPNGFRQKLVIKNLDSTRSSNHH